MLLWWSCCDKAVGTARTVRTQAEWTTLQDAVMGPAPYETLQWVQDHMRRSNGSSAITATRHCNGSRTISRRFNWSRTIIQNVVMGQGPGDRPLSMGCRTQPNVLFSIGASALHPEGYWYPDEVSNSSSLCPSFCSAPVPVPVPVPASVFVLRQIICADTA